MLGHITPCYLFVIFSSEALFDCTLCDWRCDSFGNHRSNNSLRLQKKQSNVASYSNGKLIRILFFFLAVVLLFIYLLLLSSLPFSSGLIVDDVSLSLFFFFFLGGGGGG